MFSRRQKTTGPSVTSDSPPVPTDNPATHRNQKKDIRPTRSRKEAEAANKRPLVAGDRKVAAQADRARRRELQDRAYEAMRTGDEKNMPAQHRGPERRYVRDYVDARFNLADYVLAVAMVGMVFAIVSSQWTLAYQGPVILVIYVLLFASLIDAFIMWRKLRARLKAKFKDVPPRMAFYAISRVYQFRRLRMPRPTSPNRGNFPT